jgi:hypothetical protein
MRNYFYSLFIALAFLVAGASAQIKPFTDINADYTFDVPEPTWRVTVKPTALSQNLEMVYGERLEGLLEIRRTKTEEDEPIADVILREQEQKLQFLPGYVTGKEENFAGALKGKVFNYEFVKAGKNMSGRIYFLRTDAQTVYQIRFSGYRDKLRVIRNQTDIIARTFKMKPEEKKEEAKEKPQKS